MHLKLLADLCTEINYYDLLSLGRISGEWLIVDNLLTHVNV